MKKFLDYGASIVAVLIIVAVWRFVLHYLFAPDGPLQYVPKDWVAGTQGVPRLRARDFRVFLPLSRRDALDPEGGREVRPVDSR